MADDYIEVSLHPALVEPFKEWLASRNLRLSPPIPIGEPEDNAWFYSVVPSPGWQCPKCGSEFLTRPPKCTQCESNA